MRSRQSSVFLRVLMQMDFSKPVHSPIQELRLSEARDADVKLSVLREDLIHAEVSGNKWRKLKYNVLEVIANSQKGIVTKGGPFSNHLVATAAACHSQGLQSQAFLRGEWHDNPTLLACQNYGMTIIPTSRADYKADLVDLMSRHELSPDEWWPVPEGGSNALGLKGCKEILAGTRFEDFDVITSSFGTGGTCAGLLFSLDNHQRLHIYPALKGLPVQEMLCHLDTDLESGLGQIVTRTEYHFGGYARWTPDLLHFMKHFHARTGIKTDHVYTAKMFYGILEDLRRGHFAPGSQILAIHTGGLQGLSGLQMCLGEDLYD